MTFSYDDCTTQDVSLVKLLNKYGIKATFNVNSGLLGKPNSLLRDNKTIAHFKLTKEEIVKLYEGHEVVGFAYAGGGKNYNEHIAEVIKNTTGIKYCRTIECNNSFDVQSDLYTFKPTAFHLDFTTLKRLAEDFVNL